MKGATGMDYLVRDVGQEVMPVEAGWTELVLYDKMLYEKEFTIKEIVPAVIKVLSKRFNEEVSSLRVGTIYNAELKRNDFTLEKQIVLRTPAGIIVAESGLVSPSTNIYFSFQGVEYAQQGLNGEIYYRYKKK